MSDPKQQTQELIKLAQRCDEIIRGADEDNVHLDNGNIIDLLADNIPEPLDRLRSALKFSKNSRRFCRAAWRRVSPQEPVK